MAEKATAQENLALWEAVKKTDPRMTKQVNNGRHKFTAIDAYYQIETATRVWGSYGKTWGLFDTALDYTLTTQLGIVVFRATFKFPGGEFPIFNSDQITTSKGGVIEDFAKKIETDTLTKALSRLGFNADVFLGLFDDNRYVEDRLAEEREKTRTEKRQAANQGSTPSREEAPKQEPKKNPTDLELAREEWLAAIEALAAKASRIAKKDITGAFLIEHRLAGEPGWPPGMPGEWNTPAMYRAAAQITRDKIALMDKPKEGTK